MGKQALLSLYSMNWNICLSYCHYISSHMHTNYGVTAVKMSKIHPCQILFVLMMVGGRGIFGLLWTTQGCWYSMWQGTHASSTFHASHSPDAGHPSVRQPSSQRRFVRSHNLPAKKKGRRRRWSGPGEGSPPPPSSLSCLSLCSYLGCLHPLPLQLLAWWCIETPSWQR